MAKCRYSVEVTQHVDVVIDDERIDERFMADFRQSFYEFHTPQRHAEHIGQMFVRGLYQSDSEFVEGYGKLNEAGVTVKLGDVEVDSALMGVSKP